MVHATSKLRTLAITALMASILVACGSTTTSGTTTTSVPASTPAAAAAATTSPAATSVAATATDGSAALPTSEQSATAATTATVEAKLNLNEVTEEQLLGTIPNFSTRMVREFLEYRPYVSIQQFRKEIGKYVSAEQVTAYEQYVYVPVDVDQADAATLQQLPGVDAATAGQLIADRPYGSKEAFLTKLATLVSATDAQQAAAYLAAS
jgi:DNA uptake protein ComE-like DNA-binding protein